ncbi:low temperature requirement protein A [Priestia flexa]|uniref:low temperature requirement protein A n=1 Tax=Priestia flexa TaxID=86664 RepID=UPI001B322EE4|nr:low temperature requirement protein A [Priestia flexa]
MKEKKVTWLELFYDLLFVAAVATTTTVLLNVEQGHIPFEYLMKFFLMFVPIWWAWTGQTMFINRFGNDLFYQRIFMIVQMLFVLVMTASLSTDFNEYYLPFLIGYIGLRALTAIQYLVVHHLNREINNNVAKFLGLFFLVGITISSLSIFFDSWVRYVILYAGIAVDMLIPIWGRKHLTKLPTNTSHLLERFALLTLILFGESVVSTLSMLEPQRGDWNSILFSISSFILILAMWWQYFDSVEKKINKSIQTTGQTLVYGHLFILMSLSMIAASLKLLFLNNVNYSFMLYFVFGSVLLYLTATLIVFHKYRSYQHHFKLYQLSFLLGILLIFFTVNFIVVLPNIMIIWQLSIFFIVYAKLTSV